MGHGTGLWATRSLIGAEVLGDGLRPQRGPLPRGVPSFASGSIAVTGPNHRRGQRELRRHLAGRSDDLFSVNEPQALPLRRQRRLPQAQALVFVEDAGACREELAGDSAGAAGQRGRGSHPVSQRVLDGTAVNDGAAAWPGLPPVRPRGTHRSLMKRVQSYPPSARPRRPSRPRGEFEAGVAYRFLDARH